MKILMVLPEFEEGGVERHVLWLSTELAALGNKVLVVTAGGRLEQKLPAGIRVVHLPVHMKNPLTALYSAIRIARLAGREEIDLIHAHSRVPAWIACWASGLSRKPWILTAHDRYRKNKGISPFLRADGAICVSEAVKTHLEGCLPSASRVIRNGIPDMEERWQPEAQGESFRFLFVGRLTARKGLKVALAALSGLKGEPWILDVVGDGPQRAELELECGRLGIGGQVIFRGFRDDVGRWMASADCLLFPSLDEGMPLTLMQAIRVGTPVLASRIEPVTELVGKTQELVAPGNLADWECRVSEVARRRKTPPRFDPELVPSARQMAQQALAFMREVTAGKGEARE